MLTSYTLTQNIAVLLSLYAVCAGIGLLRERDFYATLIGNMRDNSAVGFIAGVVAFTIGALIVAVHNSWSGPLESVISLIGWAALTEGVLMLAGRREFFNFAAKLPITSKTVVPFSLLSIALGIWLIVAGLT